MKSNRNDFFKNTSKNQGEISKSFDMDVIVIAKEKISRYLKIQYIYVDKN